MENKKIIYYKQLNSTNTKILELAKQGAEHGTIVVADEQTEGKGRRGRVWESPPGENVYMSMLLRPTLIPQKAPMLTLVMAYSVAKAIQELGYLDVQIKWPNDLILSGKKICGILTEMQMIGQEIESVVVGVGVNVNTTFFPKALEDKATSLYLESKQRVERDTVIQAIVSCFACAYEQFMEKQNLSYLQQEYNAMLVNCGKEVQVLEPGNVYTAVAKGINENGELLVKTLDGKEEIIYAGEVSVRGIYGYV